MQDIKPTVKMGAGTHLGPRVMVPCTVCTLPVSPRAMTDSLLRMGISIRDVTEYIEYLAAKQDFRPPTKSAMGRHLKNHVDRMLVRGRLTVDPVKDDEMLSLRQFVKEAFRRFQTSHKDWVPTHKELVDMMQAEARLAELETKRADEAYLEGLIGGLAYKSKPEEVQEKV